jgi:hypothetical protein
MKLFLRLKGKKMNSIASRWSRVVNCLADRMERMDSTAAQHMRDSLKYPPQSEEELEWGIASSTFNHYGTEFVFTLTKLGREREALLVLDTLKELHMQLYALNVGTIIPEEFVKRIKLTRPI